MASRLLFKGVEAALMSHFDENTELGIQTYEVEEGSDPATLQLLMTNSSFGHEYARKELEKAEAYHQKEELLEKMAYFRSVYFQARDLLAQSCPDKVEDLEKDLQSQKQAVFTDYNA